MKLKSIVFFNIVISTLSILIWLAACQGVDVDKTPDQAMSKYVDTVLASILFCNPAENAVNIAVNINAITVTFSEEMDSTTFTSSTFYLKRGETTIAGTISYSNKAAVFTPTGNLISNSTYQMTITAGVTDEASNNLSADYVFYFSTGSVIDTTLPVVSSTSPADNATSIYTNTLISVTFSESMNSTTITTTSFILNDGTSNVPGSVSYSGNTAVFSPSSLLLKNTVYTATLSTAISDTAGNPLDESYNWGFTTGSINSDAPTVSSTSPADSSTGVNIDSVMSIMFDGSMNQATIVTGNFTLTDEGGIAGSLQYSGITAAFTPDDYLSTNTTYTMTVSKDVEDTAGYQMNNDYLFSFTTGGFLAQAKLVSVILNISIDISLSTNLDSTHDIGYSKVSGPSNGTIGINGSIATYTPTTAYTGSDSFTYQANNGSEDSSIATVDITIVFSPFTDTGQSTCYDGSGSVITCPNPGESLAQDGSYSILPHSYTDNSDDTVTDNITGLMWQQSDDNTARNWTTAGSYCTGLGLAGYNNWRLPTVKELSTIRDLGRYDPAIDPVFSSTKSSFYWSSSTYASNTGSAWGVYFDLGYVDDHLKSYSYDVRCVRGGQ